MQRRKTYNRYGTAQRVDRSEIKKKMDKQIVKAMQFAAIVNKMTNHGHNK